MACTSKDALPIEIDCKLMHFTCSKLCMGKLALIFATIFKSSFRSIDYLLHNMFILHRAGVRGFFVIFEELVIESCQKLGTILLNKIFGELTRFKMILAKVVLLMQ